ncbi:uncharacterized protein CYBJADRAFT_139281 [Cyberlindnera jadinii NRRL Y-1542]|uniref:Uncharacterized protein n=1 Tax=Cyberlindnera jadinii (strain ATCC 18201 / CBS 1600 / BCRC 20928 / JCM 3617 / NBRC 0987 / NRRL Y-1542) TaxID=983966 RepID=A0A1E4S2F6_CYBJN|nr:hypothetical protein CYBJADRAFT_139281 [Cyberlindnera jadinii NRRL Y-1542]ODV73706.1 hypothetical protein CYBJADRAFT_139281 [Cyberlindnera jadinii NRRL Y-1542]
MSHYTTPITLLTIRADSHWSTAHCCCVFFFRSLALCALWIFMAPVFFSLPNYWLCAALGGQVKKKT